MENYIVCEKKGNQSRIHVEICRARCKNAEMCLAFQDYIKNCLAETVIKSPDVMSLAQEDMVSTRAA